MLNKLIVITIANKITKLVSLNKGPISLIPSLADNILIAGVIIPSLTTAVKPNNPKNEAIFLIKYIVLY